MKENSLKYLDQYFYGFIDTLKEICSCFEECIKIYILIEQRNKTSIKYKIDAYKYYEVLKLTPEQYNMILPRVMEFPTQMIQTNGSSFLRSRFQELMKKHYQPIDNIISFINPGQFMFRINYKSFSPNNNSANIPQQLQRDQSMYYELMEFLTKKFYYEIENGYGWLQKYDFDQSFQVLFEFWENFRKQVIKDSTYQSLYIKIKLLTQMVRFLKGERVINQKYEYFLSDLNYCDRKFEDYYMDHLRQTNLNINDEYVRQLHQIQYLIRNRKFKKQLTTFFKQDEIQQLMRETQDQLGIPQDTSINFIQMLKFSVNPQVNVICETIQQFAIIINLHSLIEVFKEIIKLPEFEKVLIGYSIVMTIHGWTQLQIAKKDLRLHIIFEQGLEEQDQQFLLRHKIFGMTENKSNLRFINQDIAEKIANTTKVKFLQKYLQVRQEPPVERRNFIF